MKRLLMIAIAATLCGCEQEFEKDGTTVEKDPFIQINVLPVRGHDYIVTSRYNGGICVVHAMSCPCRAQRIYGIEELVTTNRMPDLRDYLMEGK